MAVVILASPNTPAHSLKQAVGWVQRSETHQIGSTRKRPNLPHSAGARFTNITIHREGPGRPFVHLPAHSIFLAVALRRTSSFRRLGCEARGAHNHIFRAARLVGYASLHPPYRRSPASAKSAPSPAQQAVGWVQRSETHQIGSTRKRPNLPNSAGARFT